MKLIKLFAVLASVAVSVASCEQLSGGGSSDNGDETGTENNSGTGDSSESEDPSGSVDPSELRQVMSIEMTFVDNREGDGYDYEDEAYLQTFTYDDEGRCTNIGIDFTDEEEDDLNCAITYQANKIKLDITGYHSPLSYEIEMENGRAKSWSYAEDRSMTFDYNAGGYLSRIVEWCPEHMNLEGGCGYIAFNNVNGLCTGAYYDVNPDYASSADDALVWSESSWYPHRYPANNTSIDLNTHVINGAIEYDFNPYDVLNTIRCLGKVSDGLFERTYAFVAEAEMAAMPPRFDEPNTKYEMSYTTFKEKYDDYAVSFEFDEEGYVTRFSYTKVYEKYRVDYYYQTNEVYSEKTGYGYTRSENTYTKIGDDISCPVTVKVNY